MIQVRGSQMRAFPRLQCSVQSTDVEKSLFDGIDVTITGIARFAGNKGELMLPALTRVKELASKALAEFRIERPEAIAPHLAAGLREVRALRAALISIGLSRDRRCDARAQGT